jgi:hypothetical protein
MGIFIPSLLIKRIFSGAGGMKGALKPALSGSSPKTGNTLTYQKKFGTIFQMAILMSEDHSQV